MGWPCCCWTRTAGRSARGVGEIDQSRYLSSDWRRPEQSAAAFVDTGDGGGSTARGPRPPASDGAWSTTAGPGFRVKIHGVRVGEGEAALASHVRVRSAASAARAEGDARLVAYVVPRPLTTVAGLRRRLAVTARAAVPSSYVFLEALCRSTAQRKVDRRALETCTGQRPPGGAAFVAPRRPFERAITDAWVGSCASGPSARSTFFDLGGVALRDGGDRARLREQLRMEVDEQASSCTHGGGPGPRPSSTRRSSAMPRSRESRRDGSRGARPPSRFDYFGISSDEPRRQRHPAQRRRG
jgi:hypothetical protein